MFLFICVSFFFLDGEWDWGLVVLWRGRKKGTTGFDSRLMARNQGSFWTVCDRIFTLPPLQSSHSRQYDVMLVGVDKYAGTMYLPSQSSERIKLAHMISYYPRQYARVSMACSYVVQSNCFPLA
jgi:hypothetical protein